MNDLRFLEASARVRASSLVDKGTFTELIGPADKRTSPHLPVLNEAVEFDDGIVTGIGLLGQHPAIVISQEGRFIGGAVGEALSLQRLAALVHAHQPALTVCLGLAGGRSALSLERIGININDARIPDNTGAQPIDTPVATEGPAAYFASLPIKAMLRAVQRAGLPCEVSQTAGTFVCNHVLYGLMHLLAQGAGPAGARGGFVHVPWLTGQGAPHLPLRDMVRGIHAALWAAVLAPQDITLQAGATH